MSALSGHSGSFHLPNNTSRTDFLIDPDGSYRIISVGSDHVVIQDPEGWPRIIPFNRTEIRIYRPRSGSTTPPKREEILLELVRIHNMDVVAIPGDISTAFQIGENPGYGLPGCSYHTCHLLQTQ